MSKQTELVARLLREVILRQPFPKAPAEDLDLISHGAVLVIMRHLTERQALQSVQALRAGYGDWNEVRVSQVQEIATHLRTSSRKKGPALLQDLAPPSMALKEYLQDVFQQTHGLDLEFLRDDIAASGKTIAELGSLGLTAGGYLLWIATEGAVPVHLALARILDRLGLIKRTSSVRKATAALEPLVPKGRELEFTLCFHEIAERWNDPDEPIFMTVEAVRATPAGKKAHRDRLAQLERERVRAVRDAERQRKADAREAERLRREEERERKLAEAAARKKAREMERRRLVAEREREKLRKRKEAERKKKLAARRAAAAKKKAEARQKAGKKKASKKKPTPKKTTKQPTGKATRKPTRKKPTGKKPTGKKPTGKKPTGKKTVRKAGKPTGGKRAAPGKKAARKVTKKKPRRPPARKTTPRRR